MAPLSSTSFPLGAEVVDLIARASGAALRSADDPMLSLLHEIIAQRKLSALFQPIVRMRNGEILGYEGLIRGPSIPRCIRRWRCSRWRARTTCRCRWNTCAATSC
jgi:hypothetical protein